MEIDKVSLVIATYNSAEMLERSLPDNLKVGFSAIVIVDGQSSDSTKEKVKAFQDKYPNMIKFYQIPRRGLANARNFGTVQVETDLAMHAGPDNILSPETIKAMLRDLDNYDLVSCQTQRVDNSGYLGTTHNIYKKRYTPGPQPVVGTPYLGRTELFRQFPFNEKMLNSDDTELGQRLMDAGKNIFRSSAICQEIGFEKFCDIVERWIRWGRGDALFYRSQKIRWSLGRKIRSWLHPFKAEFLDCFRTLTLLEFIYVFPFLLLVMFLRYLGWVRFVIRGK